MPQVQDDFYAMNMDTELLMNQPFGSGSVNWDFNFAMDPSTASTSPGQVGGIPMDIEAWSSVCLIFIGLIVVLE
jgi:hypothetical protein